MFSRFYRPPALGLPFCARLGKRKYRSGARMIFFPQQAPSGAALRQKRGNPRPLPPKSGKTILPVCACRVLPVSAKEKRYGPPDEACTSFLPCLSAGRMAVRTCGHFSGGWIRQISPVTSFTSSSTPFRNVSGASSPRSIRSSSASQPEVREASAIFMPRTVS